MDLEKLTKEERAKSAAKLRKAAAIMRSGGLVRGLRWDTTGAHCALGAMNVADTGAEYPVDNPVLLEALNEMLPKGKIPYDTYNNRDPNGCSPLYCNDKVVRIAAWNNMMCVNAEDVACRMEAAATYLEEMENESGNAVTNPN